MARLRELAMHFGIAATEESPPAQPAPPARATPPSPAISTNRAASAQPFPGDFPFRQIPRLGHLDVSPGVSPDRCVSYFLSLVNASQSRHSRGHIWPDLATRTRSRRRPSVPCQGVWLSGSVPGRLAGVDLLCVALTHSGQASVLGANQCANQILKDVRTFTPNSTWRCKPSCKPIGRSAPPAKNGWRA
jgi:hypothetical protein